MELIEGGDYDGFALDRSLRSSSATTETVGTTLGPITGWLNAGAVIVWKTNGKTVTTLSAKLCSDRVEVSFSG